MGKRIQPADEPDNEPEFTLRSLPLGDGMDAHPGKGAADDPPKKASAVLINAVMFPMPPSANVYWRHRVVKMKNPGPRARFNGGYMAVTYLSKDGAAYKEMVAHRVQDKCLNFLSQEILHLKMLVCPASNRTMDIDNRVKPLFDALKEAKVFVDDSQIWKFEVERGPVIKGGRVVVTLTEIVPDVQGALSRIGWVGN